MLSKALSGVSGQLNLLFKRISGHPELEHSRIYSGRLSKDRLLIVLHFPAEPWSKKMDILVFILLYLLFLGFGGVGTKYEHPRRAQTRERDDYSPEISLCFNMLYI